MRKFEAANPDIKINTTLQSTDNLVPAFEAAAKAKKGPDIEYFWGGINTLEDGWAGNIRPISTAASRRASGSTTSTVVRTRRAASSTRLRGTSSRRSLFLYRKDVLKNAGHRRRADDVDAAYFADCKTLRAKGITPIAGGVKDGWFGGWLYSILGSQSVKSVDDVKAAVVGTQKFTNRTRPAW